MKIIKITGGYPPSSGSMGGTSYVAHELVKELKKTGIEIKVITTNADGDHKLKYKDEWIKYEGIDVFYADNIRSKAPLYSPSLISELDRISNQGDIILLASAWTWYGPKVVKLANKKGLKIFHYSHGCHAMARRKVRRTFEKFLWWHLFDKAMINSSSGVIAITEDEKNELRDLGIKREIKVIPNGINLNEAKELTLKAWKENEGTSSLPFPNEYVLYLGRMEPIKGVDLAIKSFFKLKKEKIDLKLVVAGPDKNNYKLKLQKLVSELGIIDDVLFIGLVSGDFKLSLIKSSKCILIPSVSEVLAMVLLEALFIGTPPVITFGECVPEIATKNAGISCKRDVDSIYLSLKKIINDESLRKKLSENCINLAKENYSWVNVAKETLNFVL